MWEEYKAIDPRVIRPVDGNEFFITGSYINIVDVFPKFSTEEFKKRAQENLPKLAVFNHAIKRINGHFFFIQKPYEVQLKEVEYTEDEEIENILKKEEQTPVPYEPLYDEKDKDVQILFGFKICQFEKTNQTKLTFSVSHGISDGRTAFTLFDYVRKVIQGETLEKNDEALCEFGERDRFQNIDESFNQPPAVWNEIPELKLIPDINTKPFQYASVHKIYDYKTVSQFYKANNISPQAMLMAMISRATRRYNKLPKETPIWCNTPCDTRNSPYATEEFKKHQFYCNSSNYYIKVVGQETLMEDLQHCMKQLQEAKKSNDDVHQVLCGSYVLNPETFQFIPNGRYPDIHIQATVNSSNIGKVNGTMPIFFISNPEPFMGMYNLFYHCYYTNDKFIVMGTRPLDLDEAYVQCIREEMDNIFNPDSQAIKSVQSLLQNLNIIQKH